MAHDHSIDHIDPRWKEGREYQLICGLDVKGNLRVEDNDINSRKSNRFVPYRIDSRIPVHQQPGDWGFFLIGGEWKLTRFMGREWWEESKRIGCGEIKGGQTAGKRSGWGPRTPEFQSAAGKIGGVSVPLEVRKKNGKTAMSLKEKCPICGREMSPANMGRHMRQTHKMERVKPEKENE